MTLSAAGLYKIALEGAPDTSRTWGQWAGDWGQTGKDLAFGKGLSHSLDPQSRGMLADAAMYSNPVTGVPTMVNDVSRHLYNGRFGSALGSVGMGALSFLPGAASALGVAGKGVLGAGKAVAGAAARGAARRVATNQGTRAITNALASAGRRTGVGALDNAAMGVQNFALKGQQAVNRGQQAITNAGQRIFTPKYKQIEGFQNPFFRQGGTGGWAMRSPVTDTGKVMRSTIDTAIANPASAATFGHGYGMEYGLSQPAKSTQDAQAAWLDEQLR